MLEFVFLHKTLFSEIPSCSNDSQDGYGGVLLAISNQLTSTQITKAGTDLDLETNCENVWAKISHVSVPNIMLGLQDSMISSTSGFLFFID
jgi:hypothetical protein